LAIGRLSALSGRFNDLPARFPPVPRRLTEPGRLIIAAGPGGDRGDVAGDGMLFPRAGIAGGGRRRTRGDRRPDGAACERQRHARSFAMSPGSGARAISIRASSITATTA